MPSGNRLRINETRANEQEAKPHKAKEGSNDPIMLNDGSSSQTDSTKRKDPATQTINQGSCTPKLASQSNSHLGKQLELLLEEQRKTQAQLAELRTLEEERTVRAQQAVDEQRRTQAQLAELRTVVEKANAQGQQATEQAVQKLHSRFDALAAQIALLDQRTEVILRPNRTAEHGPGLKDNCWTVALVQQEEQRSLPQELPTPRLPDAPALPSETSFISLLGTWPNTQRSSMSRLTREAAEERSSDHQADTSSSHQGPTSSVASHTESIVPPSFQVPKSDDATSASHVTDPFRSLEFVGQGSTPSASEQSFANRGVAQAPTSPSNSVSSLVGDQPALDLDQLPSMASGPASPTQADLTSSNLGVQSLNYVEGSGEGAGPSTSDVQAMVPQLESVRSSTQDFLSLDMSGLSATVQMGSSLALDHAANRPESEVYAESEEFFRSEDEDSEQEYELVSRPSSMASLDH